MCIFNLGTLNLSWSYQREPDYLYFSTVEMPTLVSWVRQSVSNFISGDYSITLIKYYLKFISQNSTEILTRNRMKLRGGVVSYIVCNGMLIHCVVT